MTTIWCLFSKDHELYDQPDHNLLAFWFEKPTIEDLAKVGFSDEVAIALLASRFCYGDSLEEVEAGKCLQ